MRDRVLVYELIGKSFLRLFFFILMGALLTYVTISILPRLSGPLLQSQAPQTQKAVVDLQAQIKATQAQLLEIKNALSTNPIAGDKAVTAAISVLNGQITDLDRNFKNLEGVLSTDPVKTLAIPMLKKDLESVQQEIADDRVKEKAEIDRVYDLNKWFVGLNATITLTLIGFVVTNAFKTAPKV